jgi:hypothetical protein
MKNKLTFLATIVAMVAIQSEVRGNDDADFLRGFLTGLARAQQMQQQQRPPVRVPMQQNSQHDPMPRPNYRWAHGQRYTATALRELAAWFQRHPQASPGYGFWEDQTNRDAKNEEDWIRSTFSGLGRR